MAPYGPHMGPYGPIWALMGPIWAMWHFNYSITGITKNEFEHVHPVRHLGAAHVRLQMVAAVRLAQLVQRAYLDLAYALPRDVEDSADVRERHSPSIT